MKKTILLLAALSLLIGKNNAQTVSDYDGNVYNTVSIGTQVWMKENLKTTHYSNGDSIPYITITDSIAWCNTQLGAYCYYNNIVEDNKGYGKLYNFFSVLDSRNLCPKSWHAPSQTEWIKLISYLGGDSVAGGKLKETGTSNWLSPNVDATNSSGFSALPGGHIDGYALFNGLYQYGYFWSATSSDYFGAYCWFVANKKPSIFKVPWIKTAGFSVRCIRDKAAQINETNDGAEIEIYPNPATNKFYVKSNKWQNVNMQVFNSLGECVLQNQLINSSNEIDISSLLKGIYILKLSSAGNTFETKLIKE